MMYGTAWKKAATADLVEQAINAGFRAIDTANQLKHYDEALVGEGLQRAAKLGIGRDSLFLQTKFTSMDGQDHRLPYDPKASLTKQVAQSVESSLEHLHTDYLDSYVLHGPFGRSRLTPEDWEVWKAIEEVHKSGKARMIGVSNFTAEQLRELCEKASVKPNFVQNRCYAVMQWDGEVREICQAHGIIYQGFSLLTANGREISSATIRGIATRLGATLAQTIFRFAQQIGMLPLTGTTDQEHMKEDLAGERFTLTPDDLDAIENITRPR
jgi:diketogulonate reductase-like aldo/keto reductase